MAYKEVSVKQPLLLTILPYISIIIFFAFWEGVVRTGIIPNTLLASPSQVFAAFIDKLSNPNPDGAVMATHAWTSIQEAFIGYVLSLVVGIPLGLAMGWFNVVEGLFRPIFELIRPIPPIAWIPFTVFWFGIGLAGKVFIIWIAGTAGIDAVGGRYKLRHRAEFGVSVAREYWGLGIGRALLNACIDCARQAGYTQLELDVVADNTRAMALYTQAGFTEYGRNPRGFRSRTAGYQELVYMRLEM